MPTCSLIIPVYRNEDNIASLVNALNNINNHINELEVIFVVDGSPDRSAQLLEEHLISSRFEWQLAQLSRNFGSFAAIRQGLALARGSYFAVMAADLQEPPELIVRFFNELERGDCDLIVGVRATRLDPLMTKFSSAVFWRLYRWLIMPEVPTNGVDVFACNSAFKQALLQLEERSSFLIGQLFWLGFRRKEIAYNRRERPAGRSAWTMRRRVSYMLDSMLAFSDLPINVFLWLGFVGIFMSAIGSVAVLVGWLMGSVDVRGYAPIMLGLIFFGFLQILGLGIVGCYVWRVSENTKQRPLSIIQSHKISTVETNQKT